MAACSVVASGQTAQEVTRKPLVGLKSFRVIIEDLDRDAISDGLTLQQLRTDAELRLRKAGITVKDEGGDAPYLYINLNAMKGEDGLYAYSIVVQVNRLVMVKCPPEDFFYAVVWDKNAVGTVGALKIRQVRDHINDVVDRFINDYLAANPKK